MTVSSTTNRKSFTGDAVTTSFGTSPVVFFNSSELVVQVVTTATGVATTLTENTHYTVTGGAGSTGTVSLAAGSSPYGAPSAAQTLVILRTLPLTQTDDFVNNDINDAEVVEDRFDKLTMMVQQLDEVDDRALKLSTAETASAALTELPFDRASKFLAFDASKNLIAAAGTTETPVSAFMATVLDDANAAAARATLGAVGAAAADVTGTFALSGDITPAQITATQNDYAIGTASVVRLSTDTARNLTGLAGGSDGRVVTLANIGAFPIVLNNEDAASAAANRFAFGTTHVLGPNRLIVLIYDSTSARWRILCIQRQTAVGQCRLTKSGANLLLSQMNGALLSFPDGSDAFVPSAGVALAATSLAIDTNFYIYATKSAGVVNALAASTTVPVQDANTGIYHKTGDATQTLVGMARTITGPAWVDTAAQRFVRSWFNDPGISARNSLASDTTTTSASLVELNSGRKAEFLLWAGEPFLITQSAHAKNNTNGTDSATATGIDGTAAASNMTTKFSTATATIDGKNDAGISAAADPVAEGYHYATLLAAVTAGTGTWFAGSGISVFTGGRK